MNISQVQKGNQLSPLNASLSAIHKKPFVQEVHMTSQDSMPFVLHEIETILYIIFFKSIMENYMVCHKTLYNKTMHQQTPVLNLENYNPTQYNMQHTSVSQTFLLFIPDSLSSHPDL